METKSLPYTRSQDRRGQGEENLVAERLGSSKEGFEPMPGPPTVPPVQLAAAAVDCCCLGVVVAAVDAFVVASLC